MSAINAMETGGRMRGVAETRKCENQSERMHERRPHTKKNPDKATHQLRCQREHHGPNNVRCSTAWRIRSKQQNEEEEQEQRNKGQTTRQLRSRGKADIRKDARDTLFPQTLQSRPKSIPTATLCSLPSQCHQKSEFQTKAA